MTTYNGAKEELVIISIIFYIGIRPMCWFVFYANIIEQTLQKIIPYSLSQVPNTLCGKRSKTEILGLALFH